jgi:cytochrome b561
LRFLTALTRQSGLPFYSLFTAPPITLTSLSSLTGKMKTSLIRMLHMSLALLIVAVLGNGCLHIDYSGASPSSLGMTRLQRDLAESRLMRARLRMVQNVISGTGDNNDEPRSNRGYFRA